MNEIKDKKQTDVLTVIIIGTPAIIIFVPLNIPFIAPKVPLSRMGSQWASRLPERLRVNMQNDVSVTPVAPLCSPVH